jgi:hypothetical protein
LRTTRRVKIYTSRQTGKPLRCGSIGDDMNENTSGKHVEAFGEGTPEREYTKEYLAEILTNWRETENSITRTAALIVVVVIIFELIFVNGISEADFAFVKLTRFGFAESALPVIAAYLYYSITLSAIASLLLDKTYQEVMSKVYPALEFRYQLPLYPTNSIFYGGGDFADLISTRSRALSQAVFFLPAIRGLVMFITPPIFLIAAYIQLFIRYGIRSPLQWVSLFIAIIIMSAASTDIYILIKLPTSPLSR